jgi:hypothetical protein
MHNMKKLILSVFIFTFGFATATHAQQVNTLLTKQLPEAPGKEIEVITVNYAPGAVDAIHRHDAHAVVYVLDGEVEMQVRGGTLRRLGPGQVFYESPARHAGLHVVATAGSADLDYVRGLGAERVVDYKRERFEEALTGVDVVLDTVGGETQQQSLQVLKRGGILVSVVSPVPETTQQHYDIRAAYFYVEVTTARLHKITELFDSGKLVTDVGTVLPLEKAHIAHEMLEGAPHKRGKIVLSIAA